MKQLIARYLKPLVLWLFQGIIGTVIGLFILYMLLEWASGCGETYVDSKGKTHIGECMITVTTKGTN